jgi:hypothetical protein
MFAYMRLVEGLLVAHLLIAIAYLLGSNATAWERREPASSADAMIRLVCTCALGFAFLGFGAFLFALLGWFNPVAAVLMVLALFAGGCAFARESPLAAGYWRGRWRLVVEAFDATHVVVYFALLVVAFPAIDLVNVGSDALAFHWTYIMDFIHVGGLTIDPFLREPFYAQNDLMLVGLVMLVGGAVFAQFVMWMLGLLTAFGICAGVRDAFGGRGLWPAIVGGLLAVGTIYSPFYLRWMDSGYLDVALGFFALATVLSVRRALRDESPDWRWLAVAATTGAFLVGSKTSLLPFAIVFAIVFAIAARRLAASPKQIAIVVGLLVLLSSPWYARNFVLAGDPIAPWLNLKIAGSDGLVTQQEWQFIADDLNTDKSAAALATVPLRIFLTPDTKPFREFATNGLMLLLYVPSLVLFVLVIVMHRKISPTVSFPIAMLTILILYWLYTSTIARYALIYFPTLALCLGFVASTLRVPIARLGPVLAAVFAICLVITPTAEAGVFYTNFFVNGVQNPPLYYTADEPFLNRLVDGYTEEQFATRTLHRLGLSGRLYLIGTLITYYYSRDGVQAIGDVIGVAGTLRFFRAEATGRLIPFLDSFGVDAVMIDPQKTQGGLDVPTGRRLIAAGYCLIPMQGSRMSFYVRSPHSCADARAIAAR